MAMRKGIACLLALLLMLAGGASAESFAVRVDGEYLASYALLVDDAGRMLTEKHRYAQIYALEGAEPARFVAQPADLTAFADSDVPLRVCLLDESGAALTGFDYTELSWDAAGEVIIGVRPDGGCDVLGADGAVRWSSDFIWLTANGEGGWLALRALGDADDPARGELVLVGADGGQTPLGARATRWDMRAYHDGLCAVYADGGYRYLDANGEAPFSLEVDYAQDFAFGTAIVCLPSGRYGLIDTDGEYVLPPVYSAMERGDAGTSPALLALDESGALSFYSPDGSRRLGVYAPDGGVEYAYTIGSALVSVRDAEGTAYFSPQGEMLFRAAEDESVSAWYARTDDTDPQRVVVQTGEWPDTECRLTDMSGAPVGESYPQLSCLAWLDGEGYFATGTFEKRYVEIEDWGGGWSVEPNSYRYGLCDEDGNELLPMVYDVIECLAPDRFWVRQGAVTGMIDTQGEWLLVISDYEELQD